MAGPTPPGKGWVVQTRRGRGYVKQPDGDLNFVIDFDGPALRALKADARLEAIVEVGANAQLRERNLFRNPVSGAWRMTVRVKRSDASKPIELRAFARLANAPPSATPSATPNAPASAPASAPANTPAAPPLTETWSYVVPPESDKP